MSFPGLELPVNDSNADSSRATRSRRATSGSGDGASRGSYWGLQLDARPRALHCEQASDSLYDEYSVLSPRNEARKVEGLHLIFRRLHSAQECVPSSLVNVV